MKTSHILSTLAALGIFLSLVAAPVTRKGHVSSGTTFTVSAGQPVAICILPENETGNDEYSLPAAKFDVSDYSYLKFNAADWAEADLNSEESLEIPVETTLDFTKFNFTADSYNELTTDGIYYLEMPDGSTESNFDYLKFNVNQYIDTKAVENGNYGEMPAAK